MTRKIKKHTKPKNSFSEVVLNVFINTPYKAYNFKQVSHTLGISDRSSRELVKEIIFDFCKSETLIAENRGKYKLNPEQFNSLIKECICTGRVDMKSTGKAYIIPDEPGEDIFIDSINTHQALNDDKVKVRLFPKRGSHKPEGEITEIIERAHTRFVGIIEASFKYAFMVPDSASIPIDFFIPKEKMNGAKDGDKVIVELTDWPQKSKNPFGTVVEVLGKPGDNEVEMQSILVAHDFPLRFPESVEHAAGKIDINLSPKEIAKRRDCREDITFTIDPLDAKDFDDALSLKILSNGNYEVGIHIADVSHYVTPNSIIDQEAYERATSIYLVDRVIPMLPEKLSNMVCSLRPNEEKYTFSAIFEMDEEAHVVNEWFGKTVINSNHRFTYEEAQEIIESGSGEYAQEILTLHDLASKLREKRFAKGSINFHSTEVRFKLDEEGRPIEAYVKEQKESNRLVEDFMLLANQKVAEKIGKKTGKQEPRPFVYRIHDEPNPEKLNQFTEFISKLGYKMNTYSRRGLATSFNRLFTQIQGKGEQNMIETIAIRTMAKAEYSTKNIGHYGLSFRYYTHFTSPIRRYPDLMVHRLLQDYLNNKNGYNEYELEEKCLHSSEMERRAAEAERASIKYKQAEYMLDKVGKEFKAVITGVSKWGIFAEVEPSKCEGLISMRSLSDDFYFLDEENYKIVGQRHGTEYQLGDNIYVLVKRIDLAKKQIDFEIA